MPIHCNIPIQPLSTEAFGKLDFRVMRHAFDSQNDLGRLADERIYQADLAGRLRSEGIAVRREVEIQLCYEDFRKSLFLDLLVADLGVYELKVASELADAHVGQLLTQLHLLDLPRGKLINFGSAKVQSKFVNAPMRSDQRRAFRFSDVNYNGDLRFSELVVGILRDWGTSLTLSLYQQAIIALLGGVETVEVMLPMHRSGMSLGNQRFHLASSDTAFKITAMNRDADAFEHQLGRLICYSPLRAIHWINVGHEEVVLKTVGRS